MLQRKHMTLVSEKADGIQKYFSIHDARASVSASDGSIRSDRNTHNGNVGDSDRSIDNSNVGSSLRSVRVRLPLLMPGVLKL